jgi:RimJ/RimL family protein N-acetyltransferase
MSVATTFLDERLILPDHHRLRIRALDHCEIESVRALYAQLSPRTRYLRFFSAMPALSESMEHLLACGDPKRRLALVAEFDDGQHQTEVIGLASFVAVDDATAEIGIVVRDDWQRQRVGTALMSRITRAAEERGYHRFMVDVLAENVGARKLLSRGMQVLSSKMSGNVSEMVLERRCLAS